MYLNFEVDIPKVPGKINYVKKGSTVYVRYVLERVYHPEKKYNVPEQRIIGKRSENNPDRMIPNETFVKYFGGQEMPEQKAGQARSSCLRIGTFLVIQKILNGYKLPEILEKYLGKKETGMYQKNCSGEIRVILETGACGCSQMRQQMQRSLWNL